MVFRPRGLGLPAWPLLFAAACAPGASGNGSGSGGAATGGVNADTSGERVMFTKTTARYVRFVALSEINGNPWASVAELRMVGGAP